MSVPSSLSAEVNGCLGLLTLGGGARGERWLTLPLLRDLHRVLLTWRETPEIQAVVLTGAMYSDGTEGFGASFDPVYLESLATAGPEAWAAHYGEAYAVCELIHAYSKPLIALIGGDAAGAAVGLACGARLRVVGDSTQLRAPQSVTGTLPDLGTAAVLAGCAGFAGEWLALTGQSIGSADAIALGLADVYVPAQEWSSLMTSLREGEQFNAEHVIATVMEQVELAPEAPHMPDRWQVDGCFGASDLDGIDAALRADGGGWSSSAADLLAHAPYWAQVETMQLIRALRRAERPLESERSAVLAFQAKWAACRDS